VKVEEKRTRWGSSAQVAISNNDLQICGEIIEIVTLKRLFENMGLRGR